MTTRDERIALAGLGAILGITVWWWALALWPVSGGGPEWLVRARAVCFGIDASGLPDAGGWVGLIGSPLGMLAVLLVGWGGTVRRGLASLAGSRAGRAILAGSVALLALGLAGTGVRVASAAGGVVLLDGADDVPETYPRLDRDAPPLALTDQHGGTATLARFEGRPVLLTFAYAHCATVCPVLVQDALHAQREDGAEPVVLVVTLDPWRDTPARLPHVAAAWGLEGDAYLLGGAVADVESVLDAWQVPRARDPQTGEVSHPALTYVIDADGRIAYASTGARATLAELLRRL
jgi:protein SCO1